MKLILRLIQYPYLPLLLCFRLNRHKPPPSREIIIESFSSPSLRLFIFQVNYLFIFPSSLVKVCLFAYFLLVISPNFLSLTIIMLFSDLHFGIFNNITIFSTSRQIVLSIGSICLLLCVVLLLLVFYVCLYWYGFYPTLEYRITVSISSPSVARTIKFELMFLFLKRNFARYSIYNNHRRCCFPRALFI